MITFFGYRGPVSDRNDLNHMVNLLKKIKYVLGKIEIIDKSKEAATEVASNLKDLVKITESKADCCGSFFESRIAQYPRTPKLIGELELPTIIGSIIEQIRVS